MLVKTFFTILLCGSINVYGANILGVVYFPSKSHHILLSSLLKGLAAKGHHVTMLSAFPLKTPLKNYEDIEVKGLMTTKGNLSQAILQMQNVSFFEQMNTMMAEMDKIDHLFFNDEAVKNLLSSKRKFDVVIQTFFGNDAYLAFAHSLGDYTVAFSTVGASIMNNKLTANPSPYSYVPNMFPPLPSEMNFLQRVLNTLTYVGMEIFDMFFMTPKNEILLRKHFPDAPSTKELISNVSLVLLNAHYSIESPRPYVPSMVQVGGLHLEEPKPLTGDLKQFMDSATEGVLFFSLGSNFRSADLPKDKLKTIIEGFSQLPLKVLWKFEVEDKDVLDLPKNVKIGKWLPQTDILAHPNVKVFVTHGGLLSTTEAVYHGVPMVGIPIFADQDANVDDGVKKGYLVKIPFLELNANTLVKAVKEVLNNPKYRENVKQRSVIFKDQPIKPIDKAVFWIEYVLRHKGAHHLKTTALKLEWYQYYLLDVIAFIFGIISSVILGIYFILYKLIKCVKGRLSTVGKSLENSNNKTKKKKSKLA